MANVIAVANQKGGVGKTATARHLALGLARFYNARVLAIDLDGQGTLSTGLGTLVRPTSTIADVLIQGANIQDAIVPAGEAGYVSIVVSDPLLHAADVALSRAVSREHRLERALLQVQDAFDYIVIDCPPSQGLLTLMACVAATTGLIIPVAPEPEPVEGLVGFLNQLDLWRSELRMKIPVLGVLFTRVENERIARNLMDGVRQGLGDGVFQAIIRKNVRLKESHDARQDIWTYDPDAPAAEDYRSFLDELMVRLTTHKNAEVAQ